MAKRGILCDRTERGPALPSAGVELVTGGCDKDGEALAVLQQGVERVAVWDAASRGVLYIDTALREPTFLRWSRLGPQLAIGSAKGGLVMPSPRTL